MKDLLHFEGGSSMAMLNNSIADFESSDMHTGPLMNHITNQDTQLFRDPVTSIDYGCLYYRKHGFYH